MVKDIRALTGIRGIAAILIVIYHFGNVQLFGGGSLDYFNVRHGYLAVDLFFMLSGYVIALNYKDAFQSDALRDYVSFMIKRIARIYPAYLAIAILYLIKIAAGLSGSETLRSFSAYDIVGNLVMATGWGLHIHPVIGVSWAASAEMGSYLLTPLLLMLTVRRSLAVCGAVVLVCLLGVYGISVAGHGSEGSLDVTSGDSFLPLARAIAGFTLGFTIYRFADIVDRLTATTQDILVAALVLAIIAAALATKGDLLLYLLFIPLVALLSRDGRLAQILFGNQPVYYFGLISYSIYLIHPLFVSFAVRGWRMFGQTLEVYVLSTAVCFAVIWLLSDLSYRFIEMPGRKLIVDLFVRKSKSSAATTGPAMSP